jgi:hypothetical protein
MNEDWSKPFHHISMPVDQLVDLLGLNGRATSVWLEDAVPYFHLIVQMEDDSQGGFYVPPYGYVEQSSITSKKQKVTDLHEMFSWWTETFYIGDVELFSRTCEEPNETLDS